MDANDLATRAINLLMQASGDPASANPDALLAELRGLKEDIDAANALSPDDNLRDLGEALSMMELTLSDPDMTAHMADMMGKDYEPYPPIYDAIDDKDLPAIRDALKTWDLNEGVGEYQSTALYHAMACQTGASIDVMTLLLDAGADPNRGLTNTNVLHALGFANLNGIKPEDLAGVIKRCVSLGADIEQRSDKLRWTPLIGAASEWNPIAVEALLLAGADITARSGDVDGVCFAGETSVAFADGHPETLAVLNRYSRPN